MAGMDVSTCIWFDGRIEEAARFYVSLVPGSQLGPISRYPEGSEFPGGTPGEALTIDFTLAGVPYQLLNGGPEFPLTEAVSISAYVGALPFGPFLAIADSRPRQYLAITSIRSGWSRCVVIRS